MDINEVDKFILHQANVRIIESVAKRLKADKDKFPVNLNEYGNTHQQAFLFCLMS